MPEPTWDPFASVQQPASAGWDPFASVKQPKKPKALTLPSSLPDVLTNRNFPDAVVPGITPEEPPMIEVEGQMVPAPVGGKTSVWNPIPTSLPSVDLTPKMDDAVSMVKGWVEKNQPWSRAGITKAQYDAMPYVDKVKLTAGNLTRSNVDMLKQVVSSPVRAVSGIGRGLVGLGQMAAENLDSGTSKTLVDTGQTPAGTVEGEFDPIMPAGVQTTATDRTVTGASISKGLGKVQNAVSGWMDKYGLNPQPTTPEGEATKVIADTGGDLALMGLAPGSTFATKGTALALGLGGRATGQTFNEATQQDLPLDKKNQAALGEGALNAAMVALPISHAVEGAFGLDTLLKKLPLGAAEGWGIGQLSNATREHAGLPVDNSFLAQLTAAGQGAAMKGMQPVVNPTHTFNENPRFTGDFPVPQQQGGQTVGGLERLLASAPDRRLGSQAIARNYFEILSQHPTEVMNEVRDYHDAQVAGIEPKPLSPEAKAVVESKPWQQLMEDQANIRNQLQVIRGEEPDANPHHIMRVMTSGVEGDLPSGGPNMRMGAASDIARTLFAIENPDGTRTVVTKGSPEAKGQKLLPATSAEIEAQTPIGIRKNPVQSVLDNTLQMSTALDNQHIVNNINNSQFAVEGPKDGYVKLEGDAKQLFDPQGTRFYDPRIKTMIDKAIADHAEPNILDKINKGIVQLGFANPTVHTPNVINHGYLSQASAIVQHPKLAMEAQDRASNAVESIMQGRPNADAIEVMRAGGRMMIPDQILNRNQTSRDAGEPSVNTQAREATLGDSRDQFATGGLEPINNMNQKYTWSTDSKARLFNYFFKQARSGMPLQDAIHEVDRAIYPNYRQTTNELEGTGTIPQLANAGANMAYNTPGISLFGSYNKAATKIASLMATDLSGRETPGVSPELASQRRGDAANHIASTVVGLGVLYPALGKALQGIEGSDQEKEAFIGGSSHKTQLFLKAVEQQDWKAASRVAGVNINPLVAVGAYTVGMGVLNGRTPNSRDLMDAASFTSNGDTGHALKAASNFGGDVTKTVAGSMNFSVPALADALQGKTDAKVKVLDMLTRGKNVYTPAESLYNRFYAEKAPTSNASWDKVDEEEARKALSKAVSSGDWEKASQVISTGNINPDTLDKTIEKLSMPKEFQLAAKAKGLSFEDQIRLWRQASPKEQQAMLALGLGDEIQKHMGNEKSMPGKLMNTKAFVDNWIATMKREK